MGKFRVGDKVRVVNVNSLGYSSNIEFYSRYIGEETIVIESEQTEKWAWYTLNLPAISDGGASVWREDELELVPEEKEFSKIEIHLNGGNRCDIYLDDIKIEGLTSFSFEVDMESAPTIQMELINVGKKFFTKKD